MFEKSKKRKDRGIRPLSLLMCAVILASSALILTSCGDNEDRYQSSGKIIDSKSQNDSVFSWGEGTDPLSNNKDMQTIKLESGMDEGDLLLVNNNYAVPEPYKQADFPSIYESGAAYSVRSTEMYIQPQALESMKTMFKAAKEDGIEGILIADTYRTQEKQERMFNNRVEKLIKNGMSRSNAEKKVGETVALAGYSEHQVGLAMDIDLHEIDYTNFEDTDLAKWMDKNSWKYGWILRYDKDKTDITGISYESWHFRYVGVCHAQYMHENDLCFEEYIQLLHDKQEIDIDSVQGKYRVMFVKADENGRAAVNLPKDCEYTVSGDNVSGYIVTAKLD